MRVLAIIFSTLFFGFLLSSCESDPVSQAERKMTTLVEDCENAESGTKLIPCAVGVSLSKGELSDEVFRVCKELSSHSLVRRDGFIYDGIGLVEGDPAIAWVYAYDLVVERLEKVSNLKLELIKKELDGFGISEWSNRCSKIYYASLELISRREGL